MNKYLSAILCFLVVNSCSNEIDIIFPVFSDGTILEGTLPVPENAKRRMEGVQDHVNRKYLDPILKAIKELWEK